MWVCVYLSVQWLVDVHSVVLALLDEHVSTLPDESCRRVGVDGAAQEHRLLLVVAAAHVTDGLVNRQHWGVQVYKAQEGKQNRVSAATRLEAGCIHRGFKREDETKHGVTVRVRWPRLSPRRGHKCKRGQTMAVLAASPTKPDHSCRQDLPLMEAWNGRECPSDLLLPAISRSCCGQTFLYFSVMFAPLAESLPSRDCHPIRWIGFSAAVTSTDATPLWFLPSFRKSLPLPFAGRLVILAGFLPSLPGPSEAVTPCNPHSWAGKIDSLRDLGHRIKHFLIYLLRNKSSIYMASLPSDFPCSSSRHLPFAFIQPRDHEVRKICFRQQQL